MSIHPLFFGKPLELLERLLGELFREVASEEIENKFLAEYGTGLPLTCYEASNYLVSFQSKVRLLTF